MSSMTQTYTREQVLAASTEYFNGFKLAADVFADKYALRDKEGRYLELTPTDMHWRLAREFARIEAKYPNPLSAEQIFEFLDRFSRIVPQGSPMFGIGNEHALVSTSNCAVIAGPQDTMSSIFDTARDMANLYKRRFGVGTDLSGLRPEGATVNNAAGSSTGAWSFADFYSYVTRMVGQSGRRGALMLTMDVRHPDIEKFITMKADLTKVTGANVSVKVSDDFMRAVENDEEYTLRWPVEAPTAREHINGVLTSMWCATSTDLTRGPAKVERVVRARDIFRLIAESATKTGEPGLLFWDAAVRNLPLAGYPGFAPTSTNPCGEIILSPNDSCRLISIYLPDFVQEEFTEGAWFDWPQFEYTVKIAMRLSDDLVDLELEKLTAIYNACDTDDECALFEMFIQACQDGRRTGLGTHGLGDALARLRIRYDSEKGIEFADELYGDLAYMAYEASQVLAEERGPFPIYSRRKEAACSFLDRLNLQDPYGPRRNGAILTNAPTGSVSIVSNNCSSGIEPVFLNSYERKRKLDAAKDDLTNAYRDAMGDYWMTYQVAHPNVERFLRLAYTDPVKYFGLDHEYTFSGTYEKFREGVLRNGKLPDYFVTADQIDPMSRIRMQGTIQRHIDHSISSTVNLPKGTTPDVVEAIYLEAWKRECKGVTVYVDGSREAQVLSATKTEEKQPDLYAATAEIMRLQQELARERLARIDAESKWENLHTRFLALERSSATHECRQRTHRGDTTSGEMFKAAFRDRDGKERKVYVYVGLNDAGQPVEVFIHDENGDPDFHPYAMALGKLISLALKHDVPCEDIEGAMRGLQGGSVSYSGKIYSSVPDLVSRRLTTVRAAEEEKQAKKRGVLQDGMEMEITTSTTGTATWYKFDGKTNTLVPMPVPTSGPVVVESNTIAGDPKSVRFTTGAPPAVGKQQCPQCGTATRLADGCPLCPECGWSKCS